MGPVAVRRAQGEREELLWAMAVVVGREGYRGASVGQAIEEAACDRAAFERHFADKQECFGAAQEWLIERLAEALRRGPEGQQSWAQRVSGGLERAVELCIANPEAARALLVCPAAAGAEGRRRELQGLERLAGLAAPRPGELACPAPARAALMAVSGVAALIGEELAGGDGAGLAGLLPELGLALLVPLIGPVAAGEELLRVAAGARA